MINKPTENRINSNKLLTIITIAKSNITELNKTYKSLKKSIEHNEYLIEWILILSGDFQGLQDKISDNHSNVRVYQQEPKGIYYAMNTAINLSEGAYSWFINAGDDIESKNFNKLIKVIEFSKKDLHFFPVIIKNTNGRNRTTTLFLKTKESLITMIHKLKMPIHHQGIIYNSNILKKYLFDETFKIRGDYENLLRIIISKKGLSISFHKYIISIFYEGGVSNKKFIHFESIKALKKNNSLKFISLLYFIYYFLRFFLKSLFDNQP